MHFLKEVNWSDLWIHFPFGNQSLTLSPKANHLTMLDIPILYNNMTQVQNTKIQSLHGYNQSELQKEWKWYIPYHYVMCCEVRKHTVFLSSERGRRQDHLPLLDLSSSIVYLNAYLVEICLHHFKHFSKIGDIFNFIDNYSDLQIPHLKTLVNF